MIADIFAAEYARAEIDIFRYTEPFAGSHRWHQQHEIANRAAELAAPKPPEVPHIPHAIEHVAGITEGLKPSVAMPAVPMPSAAQVTQAPKPKPVKLPKPPKPAPAPAPVLSKPNALGFHESTIRRALGTFQNPSGKGTREQLLKHLEGHQGAKQEAELTGLHDFLKDKPNVSREDVLKHLESHPHQVKMEEHEEADRPKWRVAAEGDSGELYDSEEEAQNAADAANQQYENNLRENFHISGEEPHYTVDTSQLEELGGELPPEASRALQRLAQEKFDSQEEARHAIDQYKQENLPNVADEPMDDFGIIEEQPGSYTIASPYSRHRHNHYFDDEYESEEEAQDAIDQHIAEDWEPPYSYSQAEGGNLESVPQDYRWLPGPQTNYNETHVAMPGIGQNLLRPQDLTAKSTQPGTISIFDKDGKEIEEYEPDPGSPSVDDVQFWINKAVEDGNKGRKGITWKDGHGNYQHIDNPVVRLRHDDRQTADGKKMFFVEEIQGPQDNQQEKMPKWVQDRIYDIGLKRALTKAVQGGYARMGWTTGDQQADRYNLRKRVDRIEWEPPTQSDLVAEGMVSRGQLIGIKDGQAIIRQNIEPNELPEYVGKEVAAKMLGSQPQPRPYNPIFPTAPQKYVHSIEGPDLDIGGRGLKDLYDRELHKRLLDIKIGDKKLKNLGVKIGTSEIPNGKWLIVRDGEVVSELDFKDVAERTARARGGNVEQGTETVHSIDIPPELAAEVKKHGVSLYKRDGEPLRFDRAMMEIVRRMPASEAAIYALGVLRLLDLRPSLMLTYTTEEIAYLRGIAGQITGK